MTLDAKSCYRALRTHDPRFDGVFFVGVGTTGIYCRTVCTAKTPRPENCCFFVSAAAAEKAGYRPCRRCRPELAPGNARVDSVNRLALIAANRIESGSLIDDKGLEGLAGELGISTRHLRRVMESAFGVSPLELAQTQRLLLAKRLLTDTDLPITEIAFASGFGSVRRFNSLFKERYGINPSSLKHGTAKPRKTSLICQIAFKPPFAWQPLLDFLAARAMPGVEAVENGSYLRTAQFNGRKGWLKVKLAPDKKSLEVQISSSLAAALLPVVAGVKRLFDVVAEPEEIAAHLGELAKNNPGLRVPGAFDGFELASRAIIGQLISVKAATTVAGRLAAAFGEPIEAASAGLNRLFPSAERLCQISGAEIAKATGLPSTKARALNALATAVAKGELVLEPGMYSKETLDKLRLLPGVGEWTAQYIAMRALCWPDAFPANDLGIYKALNQKNQRAVLELAESWRPWRAYAAMHLWQTLAEKKS